MDTWRDMSQPLKHLIRGLGNKISHILFGFLHEREEEEKQFKTYFNDSQSSVSRNSSRQELKFIALTRVICVYPKFTEDPNEEIWGNQSFRVKEVFLRPPTFLLRFKR